MLEPIMRETQSSIRKGNVPIIIFSSLYSWKTLWRVSRLQLLIHKVLISPKGGGGGQSLGDNFLGEFPPEKMSTQSRTCECVGVAMTSRELTSCRHRGTLTIWAALLRESEGVGGDMLHKTTRAIQENECWIHCSCYVHMTSLLLLPSWSAKVR